MTDLAAKLRELIHEDRVRVPIDGIGDLATRMLASLEAEFPKQLDKRRDRREEDKYGIRD